MPPSCASAIARRASVTVSIAAESIGMFRRIVLVSWGAKVSRVRQNGRMSGNEENVVKRQGFFCDT
ncbi:Uncharacterised protein [Kluyvera cryocrescens]|uniref:Uncharacterized protein n=1 Tax=Kluyvera cryocrescens TaxID=580 RepID=A0A485ATR3_KLUCR|nr:Uncharacterised protein [Kluyvera cryocrescens]